MKVVIASNFLNHHLLPLCTALQNISQIELFFVATMPTPAEQLRLGYSDMNDEHSFVLRVYENAETMRRAEQLCRECEILVIGGGPQLTGYARNRADKLTLFYSERIFKGKILSWRTALRFLRYAGKRRDYRNAYLLCTSAYAAADFEKTGSFRGRTYQWGYFPKARHYSLDDLMEKKRQKVPKLLWVGRMLSWKHPEAVVETAYRLKENGYVFELDIVGAGEKLETVRSMIRQYELEQYVKLLAPMPTEQVREQMEQSAVFLFTSDRGEGWGAVLNESMNSGCAVVASDAIGAAPYLVRDGGNGLLFRSEDWDDLYEKTKRFLDDATLRERCGRAAYRTIAELWNADVAARRLLRLADCLSRGEETPFTDGPCSRA